MKLFVSIVSHLHHSVLINLGTMKELAEHPGIEVICRDNIPTMPLPLACEKYGVHYVCNEAEYGFSANNNANFQYCLDNLGMTPNDYFVVFNPDLYMLKKSINDLVSSVESLNRDFYVPNLLLDKEEFMFDDNIRTYPKFRNFLETYLFNKRSTMLNRESGLIDSKLCWASGAFLILRARLYADAKGLDERYYLYCEDIDFCARLKKKNIYFHYLPHVKATHLRRRDSKRFMSKYFWWHVSSVFKYSFGRKSFESKKSVLR